MARSSDRTIRDGDGRGLASRTARWFSATTIMRAQIFADDGLVKIVELSERTAVARVQGRFGKPSWINVAAPVTAPEVLRCGCSCPTGEAREACEHVYATLLELDRRRVTLGLEVARARVEIAPPWVPAPARPVDDWDSIVDVAGPGGGRELPLIAPRGGPRPPPLPRRPVVAPLSAGPPVVPSTPRAGRPWAERLSWLAAEAADEPRGPARLSAYTLEYQLTPCAPVDPDGTPRTLPDRLELTIHQRTRRRDGTAGRRDPLSLQLDGSDHAPEPVDRDALQAMRLGTPIAHPASGYADEAVPALKVWHAGVRVATELVDRILPAVAATGRLGWLEGADPGRTAPLLALRWDGDVPFRLTVSLHAVERGLEVTATAVRGDERLPLSALTALFGAGCAALGERLIRIDHGEELARWWAAAGWAPMVVPRGQVAGFVEQFAGVSRLPALEIDPATGWSLRAVSPTPHLQLEALPAGGGHGGRVAFAYGQLRREGGARGGLVLDPVGRVLHPVDRAAERRLVDELRAMWPEPAAPPDDVVLPPGALADAVPVLEAAGWEVWLRKRRVRAGGRMKASVASGIDWFDVSFAAVIDDVPVDALALVEALRAGRNLVRLRDGSEGVVPEAWVEQHRALLEQGTLDGGLVRVPRNRALVLDLLLEGVADVDVDASFGRLRERLAGFAGVAPRAEPRGFRGELRQYQREGLGWLDFLRDLGFGGCLADDMGLGKTVQVLAAIIETRRRKESRPSLVVAPKSVVWNWLDEAAKFAPGLVVVDYNGPDRRARLGDLDRADLVVTSYATMRLDIAELSICAFEYVILDEAQAIKNPDSQVARAARALRGAHRLALTGTPVENHLGDLASIFEFLNPGMLDGVAALRRLASRRPPEAGELAPLARALRPFLLRRTKAQVLPELPARSEQVLKVRLEGAQRRFYDQLREGYRASLLARVERDGMSGSTMHVLEALLRLRQAACAPGLVAEERAPDGSAKLDLLLEQVAEVCAEGHKVLVFSQFTSLLAMVRTRLDEAGIVHEYLDGQTRDRKARVTRFQDDPACQVFAISLKAGGTGLNLTAASYVYLLDPWWNPAVEAQAIDRAHRLGQARAVTAYRLIAEDTVEDKILELQHHKRALLEGLFAEDAGRLASLTASDLAMLLAP